MIIQVKEKHDSKTIRTVINFFGNEKCFNNSRSVTMETEKKAAIHQIWVTLLNGWNYFSRISFHCHFQTNFI